VEEDVNKLCSKMLDYGCKEILCSVLSDVNKIQEGIGDKFANFFQYFTTFVAGIVIGLAYGWKLALVILACSPLLVICGGILTLVS
jgi:ABC-type bacteriocin/lantibiotic exporter with double-glycine peptidase domain